MGFAMVSIVFDLLGLLDNACKPQGCSNRALLAGLANRIGNYARVDVLAKLVVVQLECGI